MNQDIYSYICDECGAPVKSYNPLKCDYCRINLCAGCYSKRKYHACKWCYSRIPNYIIVRRKISWILLFVIPVLLVFTPVPKPAILMFFDGSDYTWWEPVFLFGVICLSIALFVILILIDKNKIKNALYPSNSISTASIRRKNRKVDLVKDDEIEETEKE
jgi:hypothetical protein